MVPVFKDLWVERNYYKGGACVFFMSIVKLVSGVELHADDFPKDHEVKLLVDKAPAKGPIYYLFHAPKDSGKESLDRKRELYGLQIGTDRMMYKAEITGVWETGKNDDVLILQYRYRGRDGSIFSFNLASDRLGQSHMVDACCGKVVVLEGVDVEGG